MTVNALPTRMESVTQAKRWLKDKLIAELPMWLQRGDQLAHDGVTTPPPRDVRTTDVTSLNDYPGIEIMPGEDDPVADSYATVLQHRLMVGVTVAGDDEETLAVQVERYIWAIRHIAKDTLLDPPESVGGPILAGKSGYTPVANRPEGMETPYVKGGFIELNVQTVE